MGAYAASATTQAKNHTWYRHGVWPRLFRSMAWLTRPIGVDIYEAVTRFHKYHNIGSLRLILWSAPVR